jgi:glycogen operon protein
MAEPDWDAARTLTVYLNGHGIPEADALGEPILDDSFLLLFNPSPETVPFTLPDERYGSSWQTVVDTADPLLAAPERAVSVKAGDAIDVPTQTVIVLRSLY